MTLPAPYADDAPLRALRIAQAPAVPTVVVRRDDFPVYKMTSLMDDCFAHLVASLEEAGIAPIGPAFALHHRFPVDTADIEVGLPVDRALESPIELPSGLTAEPSELPAGRVALISHLGGYAGLAEAWGMLTESIGEAGEQMRYPLWELYVSNPAETKDPARLRTDLVTLLEEPTPEDS